MTLLNTFIFLFAVIDPIGSVPVFIHVVRRVPPELRRAIAVRAVAISAIVLIFFIVLGQLLLEAISIELSAFQAGGGVILFLFAIDMIFGSSKPEREAEEADKADAARDLAVYPMAIPSIAGPGAILAVIMLTDNNRFSFGEQLVTTILAMCVLAIVLVCLLSGRPHRAHHRRGGRQRGQPHHGAHHGRRRGPGRARRHPRLLPAHLMTSPERKLRAQEPTAHHSIRISRKAAKPQSRKAAKPQSDSETHRGVAENAEPEQTCRLRPPISAYFAPPR